MKRYRFPLATALRVRRIEEDRAKLALADALRQVAEAERVLEETLDHYQGLQDPGDVRAETFLAVRARQALAASSVIQAGTTRLVALETESLRRERLRTARTDVAALERLDERRREEHRLDADREEVRIVDDIVVSRYNRSYS